MGVAGIFRLLGALLVTADAPASASDGGAPASAPPRAPSLLLAPSRNGPRDDLADRYALVRAHDGTGDLVYEAPGFTARIARDGGVRFVDHTFVLGKGTSFIPFAPLPMPAGTPTLQGFMIDVLTGRPKQAPRRREAADDEPPPFVIPQTTRYRPDPREACQVPRPCAFDGAVPQVGVAGTFDVTDQLLRLSGQDPYRRAKAGFLASTAELRAGLAARATATAVRRAATELPARLAAIACDASRPVRERRAVIDALRDEIDGDTPASRDAVALIARFVATHFDDADGGVRCP